MITVQFYNVFSCRYVNVVDVTKTEKDKLTMHRTDCRITAPRRKAKGAGRRVSEVEILRPPELTKPSSSLVVVPESLARFAGFDPAGR